MSQAIHLDLSNASLRSKAQVMRYIKTAHARRHCANDSRPHHRLSTVDVAIGTIIETLQYRAEAMNEVLQLATDHSNQDRMGHFDVSQR